MVLRASSVRRPEMSRYSEAPAVVIRFERVKIVDTYLLSTIPQ